MPDRYSAALQQRFLEPSYAGVQQPLATAADAATGDAVTLGLQKQSQVARWLGFYANGSPSTIAAAEWVCEQVNVQSGAQANLKVSPRVNGQVSKQDQFEYAATLDSMLSKSTTQWVAAIIAGLALQPEQHYSAILVTKVLLASATALENQVK